VLKHRLMPHAALATPNLAEAAMLSGAPPHDRAGLLAWAANAPCAVLLTGGDVEGTIVTDTLVYGRQMRDFTGPRVQGGPFHGTGCTLSSAIAARLAIGESLGPAVEGAIAYTRRLVAEAANRSVGRGARPLPHGYRTPS
jgi:hydroxymethylpyrimidine/phosphomethylpyrimidine kinase